MCRDNLASLVSCAPWCSQNVPRFSSHMQLFNLYLFVCLFLWQKPRSLAPCFTSWVWLTRLGCWCGAGSDNTALVIVCVWNRVGEGAAAATKSYTERARVFLPLRLRSWWPATTLPSIYLLSTCNVPNQINWIHDPTWPPAHLKSLHGPRTNRPIM